MMKCPKYHEEKVDKLNYAKRAGAAIGGVGGAAGGVAAASGGACRQEAPLLELKSVRLLEHLAALSALLPAQPLEPSPVLLRVP